jgi:hypothetical protein
VNLNLMTMIKKMINLKRMKLLKKLKEDIEYLRIYGLLNQEKILIEEMVLMLVLICRKLNNLFKKLLLKEKRKELILYKNT